MNQDFYDDSSAVLGLNHSAYSADPERLRQKQLDDKAKYLEETGVKDTAARLIEYYRNLGMRPKDAEDAGIERFLSLAAGVYDRMWKYIDKGMELDTAILKAEMELTEEADIEAQAIAQESDVSSDERPDDKSVPWPEKVIEDLMDMHRKTKGGGSKSKSRKTITKPDAPVVEQALRRDMVA